MSDAPPPEPVSPKPPAVLATTQPPAQNVRVDLNTAALVTTYSNFFRVTGGARPGEANDGAACRCAPTLDPRRDSPRRISDGV